MEVGTFDKADRERERLRELGKLLFDKYYDSILSYVKKYDDLYKQAEEYYDAKNIKLKFYYLRVRLTNVPMGISYYLDDHLIGSTEIDFRHLELYLMAHNDSDLKIEIIKEGVPPKYEVTCPECGCVFKFQKPLSRESMETIGCPYCNTKIEKISWKELHV